MIYLNKSWSYFKKKPGMGLDIYYGNFNYSWNRLCILAIHL